MSKPFEIDANTSIDELLEYARLCELSERYDDMIKVMSQVVINKDRAAASLLTIDECNLLSVAYKNVIGAHRSAYRVLSSHLSRCKDDTQKTLANSYRQRVTEEMQAISDQLFSLLDNHVIKHLTGKSPSNESEAEQWVFFYKMIGDYRRYLVEIADTDTRQKEEQLSDAAYLEATKHSDAHLKSTNPNRLGLALNFSVFNYEIKNRAEKAVEIAKTAFDNAMTDLDNLNEDSYKESTMVMQLLRDNLTLWTDRSDGGEQDE